LVIFSLPPGFERPFVDWYGNGTGSNLDKSVVDPQESLEKTGWKSISHPFKPGVLIRK
jgi:hypothetical protein